MLVDVANGIAVANVIEQIVEKGEGSFTAVLHCIVEQTPPGHCSCSSSGMVVRTMLDVLQSGGKNQKPYNSPPPTSALIDIRIKEECKLNVVK